MRFHVVTLAEGATKRESSSLLSLYSSQEGSQKLESERTSDDPVPPEVIAENGRLQDDMYFTPWFTRIRKTTKRGKSVTFLTEHHKCALEEHRRAGLR